MADLGADVIHVEPPGTGDTARSMGPSKDGVHLWWKVSGRNKRSVAIDLRRAEGQALVHELVRKADVVIASFRAPTLDRWALDWETLHALNPKLVMLQVSGFGANTSERERPGFGKVGEARSGVVAVTGFSDTPPVHTGFSHGDATTGLMGAFAVMSALYRRNTDSDFDGEFIDLALFETLYRLIEWQVIVHDQLGTIPGRNGNRLPVAPAAVINTYLTADQEWITVTSATQRSVLNVVRLLGLPEAEFDDVEKQHRGRDILDDQLKVWVRDRSTASALDALQRAEVVASRIFTVEDIVADDIYAELGNVIGIDDQHLGTVKMQGVIPRLQNHPGKVWRTGAELGADTESVLERWLSLTPERKTMLLDTGIIADRHQQEPA